MSVVQVNPRASETDHWQLQTALDALQATATNFSAMCINDSKVRVQYMRDISAIATEFQQAVQSGRLSPSEAAAGAQKLRNQILELSRLRSSPTGRAYATQLKKHGRTFAELTEKWAQNLFKRPFGALSEAQQASVYLEVIKAAGRADQNVAALARTLGKVGQRLLLVSLAIAVYDISMAEDKPHEVARQGALAAAGVAGGWALGAGAVATGVCVATAPVCVGAAALIGGLLFAFGADLAFGTVYPRPGR